MDSKSGFILNPKIIGGVIVVLAIVVLAITYSGTSIIDDTPEDEIIESANFVTQPSDRKLFDTTIQTQSAFSKNVILHYMETIEMDENGEEFTQIWVEIDTITGETARFTYLKFSEAVIDEYDGKKLVLIQVLTKDNDGINKNYLLSLIHI